MMMIIINVIIYIIVIITERQTGRQTQRQRGRDLRVRIKYSLYVTVRNFYILQYFGRCLQLVHS